MDVPGFRLHPLKRSGERFLGDNGSRQLAGHFPLCRPWRLRRLGVTRTTLSELVNEKRGISPEMAVRLSRVFGGSAQSWLIQQAQYDLAHVHADRLKLKRLAPV
jgi:hypothetical protein